MKKLIVYIILICSININAQELLPAAELFIQNWSTTKNVYVKVIPVGFIFNGKFNLPYNYSIHEYKYSPEAARPLVQERINFVFGGNKKLLKCSSYGNIEFENYFYLSTDNSTHNGIADSLIGIGKYKIEFWNSREENGEDILTSPIDYCYIDFGDFDYPGGDWYTGYNDVWIKYYSDDNIKFQFTGIELPINHECANRDLKIYKQIIGESPCSYSVNKSPNKNGFQTTTETQGLSYLYFPIKATNYTGFSHINPSSLFLNLNVASGHNALLKTGETMNIEYGATFSILQNAIFTLQNNSILYVKSGGLLCNYGIINREGNAVIKYERGINGHCITPQNAQFKGVNVIFEDSAIVEFPDSTTITFDSSAVFTMMPHSELRLGKNTKLVFLNGSRINCNNAKITSLDSTQTWDGIYLSGIAYDTLKNCTFQNAVNGINITDNYNPFGSPGAVEISDCIFKNSTSTELLNYVYVNNSYNVLVNGCNAVKTGSAGFTAGIIAEYCPAGGVVICDNNINYVNTGISLLQSSEYIARNVITGYSNTGTGIYLDNSNGTIEYNTVNNFQKSIYGSYSSPYLLKNSLIDAYITNIDLVNSSMPVMKPVISSSTLRWLGGNNNITGYPTNSGIRFADCYPLIDSGYNKIIVNGSDYLNGNFTFLYTEVPARINYWYDNPPNSSLFDISGGYADYSNPFNGTSLPATDGSELNSIGWGLYDTVFTKTLGDNPTPEDLFTQAYTEEMSGNYTDAITHYKEVVSNYKTSQYAPVALARIFNCLEKSRANLSQYYTLQGYYTNIQNNSAYPNTTRELSEDFKIKSKVKQFNIEEAISDYETIYQNNQNNAKGIHALINKFSLQRIASGDAPNGSTLKYTEHKLGILSLITGKDLKNNSTAINNQPNQFRLHQNYPNPFNPTTSIKYDIPKSSQVTIKVYDILGKEVFSYNEYKLAGSYEVKFDGSNLASGMYFYSLETTGYKDTKKMVLLK